MDFVAVDVETANADMASICQIGIAKYSNGTLIEEWSSLVNPQDYFDDINIDIHGISENDVVSSPTFRELYEALYGFFDNKVSVCHTHFDRVSITRAVSKYDLDEIKPIWLDSAKVARRTWKEFSARGYGLANICKHIGYEFKHHDALEDAKAAGEIILAAINESGLDLDSWLKRVQQPITPKNSSSSTKIKIDGNPEGALYGEVIVFTGALEIPRREAADLASIVGCAVSPSVTKKTTILVVGDLDISKTSGRNKSTKHVKVEQLISKGQNIRIIKESDFKQLVNES